MLMVFSLLSERRRPRCVVSDDSDIVFSLRSNENDFLEYDFGLFSRTALDLSGCIVTRSCFECLLTTFVMTCSSFSHSEINARSSAQVGQTQYVVPIDLFYVLSIPSDMD